MNPGRQAKLAESVRQCADKYLEVVRAIQQELVRMTRAKVDTGHFPEDSERKLLTLSQKGRRLSIRMLRLRALLIEAGLSPTIEAGPTPDSLPEDW